MASIDLPPAKYPLFDALGDEFVENGKLSQLQLEGILYACQKHCEFAPDGKRSGFMIGDGAGVGKGRQISGIIIDNYVRGRLSEFERKSEARRQSSTRAHARELDARGSTSRSPSRHGCATVVAKTDARDDANGGNERGRRRGVELGNG